MTFKQWLESEFEGADTRPDEERLEFATRHLNAFQAAKTSGVIKPSIDDAIKLIKYLSQAPGEPKPYMVQRCMQMLGTAIKAEISEVVCAKLQLNSTSVSASKDETDGNGSL